MSRELARERQEEFADVMAAVRRWSEEEPDIVAVALVGSWARNAAQMGSHIDIVVLTSEPDRFASTENWINVASGRCGKLIRTRKWGPLTERRVLLEPGLEIDYGFAGPQWANVPPDAGTTRVVSDGLVPIYDPMRVLHRLRDAT